MLYDNIKAICDKKKLTISWVEKEAGLSNGTIGKWRETGAVVNNVYAVAKVLNVSVEELLVG